MALQDSDLLIIQRPATKEHFNLKWVDLKTNADSGSVPDGTEEGQYLAWSGTEWEATDEIDGGEYAT